MLKCFDYLLAEKLHNTRTIYKRSQNQQIILNNINDFNNF